MELLGVFHFSSGLFQLSLGNIFLMKGKFKKVNVILGSYSTTSTFQYWLQHSLFTSQLVLSAFFIRGKWKYLLLQKKDTYIFLHYRILKARRGSIKRLKRTESSVVFLGKTPAKFCQISLRQKGFRVLSSLILVFLISWIPYSVLSILKVILEPKVRMDTQKKYTFCILLFWY